MSGGSTGERLWRAVALLFLIVLIWQLGNAALSGPAKSAATTDDVDAPRVRTQAVQPTVQPTPSPTVPPAPTRSSQPSVSVAPGPDAKPVTTRRVLRVANTGGIGVFLRSSPRQDDRLQAWPDDTEMLHLGQEVESDGRRWVHVQAPDGVMGWIPAQFLAER